MKIQFKITNMSCESCAKINEKYLMKTKGVTKAKVDYRSALASIEYDEKMISESKIKEVIINNGYGII